MYSKTSLCHYRHLLQWCHNERDGVSRRLYCLPHNFYRHRSKKTAKSRVTGLCEGNSPVTGEFPAQRSSNTENDSIWCRHHASKSRLYKPIYICVCVQRRHSIARFIVAFGPTRHQIITKHDIDCVRLDDPCSYGERYEHILSFCSVPIHYQVNADFWWKKWTRFCRASARFVCIVYSDSLGLFHVCAACIVLHAWSRLGGLHTYFFSCAVILKIKYIHWCGYHLRKTIWGQVVGIGAFLL